MAISYPVDVRSTLWTLLHVPTGTLARNRRWPVADGGPIPGLSPDYVYLLQVADAQPDYDSRLQLLEATEVVDVPANQLRVSYTTPLRPADDLHLSINQRAESLIAEAMSVTGITSPTDILDGLGLVAQVAAGQSLNAGQADRLAQIRLLAGNYLDAVKARAAALRAWVDAHPGESPDIDAGWPEIGAMAA